jgi:hypothetical protein
MKRLYRATGIISSYFMAEDGVDDVFRNAFYCLSEDMRTNGITADQDIKFEEITKEEQLGEDKLLCPWFADDKSKTCADYLNQPKSCNGKVVEIEGRKYKLTEIK